MTTFQPLSGFYDDVANARLSDLESRCWTWAQSLGFSPVRLPIVESRTLFERGVGNGTDVVDKEMFTLRDNENSTRVLRPEGTSGAMRAWLNAGGRSLGGVRWAYCGPMFRNERPQAGRFRQFNQFGLEAIGVPEGMVEADLLAAMDDLFKTLGFRDQLTLRINTLGTSEERRVYRDRLQDFLNEQRDRLDPISQGRILSNPLRVWDSKDPGTQAVLREAPRLIDGLGETSLSMWNALRACLDAMNVVYEVDPGLVRGLDYYSGTVFEWTTSESKAQNAVAGGGRYDGLATLLGGDPTPAFGMAMGLERLLALLPTTTLARRGAYVIWRGGPLEQTFALQVAREARQQGLTVGVDDNGGKIGKQIARANAVNARYAMIVGEQERSANQITVKDLETGEQRTVERCEAWGQVFETLSLEDDGLQP